jgi:hypothetical protein
MKRLSKCSRLRFRFGLRTLFVAVTIAGVIAAWVTYQLNWIRQRHDVFASHRVYEIKRKIILSAEPGMILPPWSLRVFGETGQDGMMFDLAESDPELERIRRLFPEAEVRGRTWASGSN